MFADGGRYDGAWKDGKWYGHGVLVGANGNRYEGDFKVGKPHGRGTVTDDGDKCDGDWREGRLLGMGKGRKNEQLKKCYLDGGTITFVD